MSGAIVGLWWAVVVIVALAFLVLAVSIFARAGAAFVFDEEAPRPWWHGLVVLAGMVLFLGVVIGGWVA